MDRVESRPQINVKPTLLFAVRSIRLNTIANLVSKVLSPRERVDHVLVIDCAEQLPQGFYIVLGFLNLGDAIKDGT